MTISRLQYRADTNATPPATNSLAFTSNVTAGSLLVVAIRSSANNPSDPTVTDTLSNTWSKDVASTAASGGRVYLYSTIANGSGANTVQVAGTTATRLAVWEFAGSWDSSRVEDFEGAAATGSVSPEATNAVTTASAGLVLALMGTVSDVTFSAVTNSFTREATASSRLSPSYRIVTTGGNYSTEYSWTGTDNNTLWAIAAYKEIPGPTISAQPTAQTARVNGDPTATATFSVTASGTGGLTYDWELETSVGGGSYSNLADGNGATWTGQAAASCVGTFSATTLSGRRVRCNVTDSNGTTTTSAVTLTVLNGPVLSKTSGTTNGSGVDTLTLTSDDALTANGELLLVSATARGITERTTLRPA
jgi:hypothetical protein